MDTKRVKRLLVVLMGPLGGALAAVACAPVFSDFQSAKLVGPGRVELTPSASRVSFSGEDGGRVQDEYGVQVGAGVLDRLDLRAGYVRMQVADGGGGINAVGFGPKIGLVKDRVALAVPVGFAFGQDVEIGKTWTVHPTLLLTQPVVPRLEVNASVKGLIPLSKDGGDTLVAVNLGLALGDLERWAIRPEIGFLFNPGESGHFTHLGLGFTVFAGKKKPSRF
jgi:hypothetical protein